MTNKFLLEIGTEEIPARFIESALEQLKTNSSSMMNSERIKFEDIKTYATPRRLVLLIEGIADKQEDFEELIKGPSKKIAYDDEGNPTKALIGFAKGQGVNIEDIVVKEYKGEDYVYAYRFIKGKEVDKILKENLVSLIKNINFPKTMRWGGKKLKFARPIRWILSLLNNKVIKISLEGIKSSNITRGHRFLGSSNIEINNVDEYFQKLKENYVIVDQTERREKIKHGCDKLAKEMGGNLLEDNELLDELTYIVEYPTPLIGRIKEEYLTLPKEVLITPMKEHQRYYPIVDDKNRLLPYFIAVRNGNEEYLDIVTKGNEKVLDARLEDAKFFYNEDIRKPLNEYVDELKNIVFQQKLGTLYDKTIRMGSLAKKMSEYLNLGIETEKNIERASYLSKADLVTKMVNEFTELQGIMGKEYAEKSGENEIVSLAIYEHYLPRFAGDVLPTTTAGSIMSISDKLDTIVGSFMIGIQPTGSQDPYGLRRQSLGIINIILDKNLHVSISKLIDFALEIYAENNGLVFDYDKIRTEIIDFFNGRIKNMFIEMGIRYDIVDAVLATGGDDIADLLIRAQQLNEWINNNELQDILSAFNRVANLSIKADNNEIREDLLKETEEIELFETFYTVEDNITLMLNNKEYGKALDELIKLRKPIDEFFDNVMVMVDNDEIRNNRLALIKTISDTMLLICDLSKIVNQ